MPALFSMTATSSPLTLHVMPANWQTEVSPDLTLLEAALLAGIVMPNSCRNGTCRTCLCRLTAGRVRYTIAWPGVSQEEREEGYILPCVAQPLSDVTLEVQQARQVARCDSADK